MKEYLREYLVKKGWEDVDAKDIENIYYGTTLPDYPLTKQYEHEFRLRGLKSAVEKLNWHICDRSSAWRDTRDWYDRENGEVESFEPSKEFVSPIEYAEI